LDLMFATEQSLDQKFAVNTGKVVRARVSTNAHARRDRLARSPRLLQTGNQGVSA
jgi:hypothetical protein